MNRRLDSLVVKNYRQLKNIEVEFIGDINLIVGRNNSGKSTLLEAIRLLASRGSTDLMEEILNEHGELQVSSNEFSGETTPEMSICNLFTGRKFPSKDGISIYVGDIKKSQFVQIEHVFQSAEMIERLVDGEQSTIRRLKKIAKDDREELQEANDALEVSVPGNSDLFSPITKTVVTSLTDLFARRRFNGRVPNPSLIPWIAHSYVPSRATTQDELADVWDDVVLTDAESYVLKAMRLIEPGTAGLAFIQGGRRSSRNFPNRTIAYERHAMLRMERLETPVPLQSMGDGMTRVLQLILNALKAKNGFLLIDEFENGLHYSVQEQVWRLIFELASANHMQVFATTHSDDCVRAFSTVATEHALKGVLIRVERTDDESDSVVSSVTEVELNSLVGSNVDVR